MRDGWNERTWKVRKNKIEWNVKLDCEMRNAKYPCLSEWTVHSLAHSRKGSWFLYSSHPIPFHFISSHPISSHFTSLVRHAFSRHAFIRHAFPWIRHSWYNHTTSDKSTLSTWIKCHSWLALLVPLNLPWHGNAWQMVDEHQHGMVGCLDNVDAWPLSFYLDLMRDRSRSTWTWRLHTRTLLACFIAALFSRPHAHSLPHTSHTTMEQSVDLASLSYQPNPFHSSPYHSTPVQPIPFQSIPYQPMAFAWNQQHVRLSTWLGSPEWTLAFLTLTLNLKYVQCSWYASIRPIPYSMSRPMPCSMPYSMPRPMPHSMSHPHPQHATGKSTKERARQEKSRPHNRAPVVARHGTHMGWIARKEANSSRCFMSWTEGDVLVECFSLTIAHSFVLFLVAYHACTCATTSEQRETRNEKRNEKQNDTEQNGMRWLHRGMRTLRALLLTPSSQ